MAGSLAFVWACLTGEIEVTKQGVKRNKHGYSEISVFRLGLDTLQDLLLHPSPASWHTLGHFMHPFEGSQTTVSSAPSQE